MLAILPLMCFMLLFSLFAAQVDWRRAFLAAALVWGLIVALSTEILSAFQQFTRPGVVMVWGAALLAAVAALLFATSHRRPVRLPDWPGAGKFEAAVLGGIALAAGVTLIVAFLAPPNNWDSMSYHMARVAHWIQNHGTSFYPTTIDFQLHLAPWAEYAIAHFQLLAGADRLANLVQWFSMTGCAIGVSLMAGELGADTRGQLLAAWIGMTIPIGILEASSTQNDYVAAFWVVSVAHYTLRAAKHGLHFWNSAASGASMALAVFTKGTTYFFAFPFVIGYALVGFRAARWRFVLHAVVIAALFAAVNAPHLIRTAIVFRNPLGPSEIHTVENIGPASLASNIIRHTLMNLYLPTENGPLAQAMNTGVGAIHDILGISPADPRTSFTGHRFQMPYYVNSSGINPYAFHEDRAGNPLHVLFYALAATLACTSAKLRRDALLISYLGSIAAGFLLLCLLVKWTMFASRIPLPLYILTAPFAAAVFSRMPYSKARLAIVVILLLQALPFLFINYSRPAIPRFVRSLAHGRNIYDDRHDQYFTNRPDVQASYEGAVEYLVESGCVQIGLVMATNNSSWEYPLWVLMLEHYDYGSFRFEHVLVHNPTRVIAERPQFRDFEPCALVLLDDPISAAALDVIPQGYVLSYTNDRMSVFMRQ